jgi:hypothetical protein
MLGKGTRASQRGRKGRPVAAERCWKLERRIRLGGASAGGVAQRLGTVCRYRETVTSYSIELELLAFGPVSQAPLEAG